MASINERKETTDVKQIYLLCRECDGSMVDAQTRACDCGRQTESRDFLFCFACALTKHRCQSCGQHVEVSIASC